MSFEFNRLIENLWNRALFEEKCEQAKRVRDVMYKVLDKFPDARIHNMTHDSLTYCLPAEQAEHFAKAMMEVI